MWSPFSFRLRCLEPHSCYIQSTAPTRMVSYTHAFQNSSFNKNLKSFQCNWAISFLLHHDCCIQPAPYLANDLEISLSSFEDIFRSSVNTQSSNFCWTKKKFDWRPQTKVINNTGSGPWSGDHPKYAEKTFWGLTKAFLNLSWGIIIPPPGTF